MIFYTSCFERGTERGLEGAARDLENDTEKERKKERQSIGMSFIASPGEPGEAMKGLNIRV